MIRRLISSRITAAERTLGVPADYLRHILNVSLGAFFKFVKIMPLANYRKQLPTDAYHVGRLVVTQHQDCGTCVQIEVNLAKRDRVPATVIQAVLDGKPSELPDNLADVYYFAEHVAKATGEEEPFRERIRRRYGEAGLVELAMAIAACQVFPITKRALGFAKSCSAVRVQV